MMKRSLERSLGLTAETLAFYDFPDIADPDAFKVTYRAALDLAGAELGCDDLIAAEAEAAFAHNIAVSEAVFAAVEQSAA